MKASTQITFEWGEGRMDTSICDGMPFRIAVLPLWSVHYGGHRQFIRMVTNLEYGTTRERTQKNRDSAEPLFLILPVSGARP